MCVCVALIIVCVCVCVCVYVCACVCARMRTRENVYVSMSVHVHHVCMTKYRHACTPVIPHMHRLTMTSTLPLQFHGGSKTLEPESRLPPSRSMHRSQFQFGGYGGHGSYPGYPGHDFEHPDVWTSDYSKTYFQKDIVPVSATNCKCF